MKNSLKKAMVGILSVALLSSAIAVTIPAVTASTESVDSIPSTASWKMVNLEDYEGMQEGASYQNWDYYCKKVKDEVVKEKGFKDSQALYVHSTEASTEGGYSQPFYFMGKETEATGAEELWLWVDFSSYDGANNLTIRPQIYVKSKGESLIVLNLKSDAPVYYQSDDGLKKASKTLKLEDETGESALVGADLEGFKGYIRMPLASFNSGTGLNLTQETIIGYRGAYFIFTFNFAQDESGNYVENGFYYDNLLLAGSELAEGTPLEELIGVEVPDVSTWKAGMVEDMEAMADGAEYTKWGGYCKNVTDAATPEKGFKGSKGLYVHSTAAAADTGYSQPWYFVNKSGDYSGAKEIWIWYDFSKYDNPASMEIRPRITAEGVDGNIDLSLIPKAPVYLHSESGVTVTHVLPDASMISGSDLKDFKGFIRMPLTSFKPNKTLDMKTAKITSYVGMYNVLAFQFKVNENDEFVETGYVMDNIVFVGPDMTSTLTVADMVKVDEPEPTTTTEPEPTTTTEPEPTTTTEPEPTTTTEPEPTTTTEPEPTETTEPEPTETTEPEPTETTEPEPTETTEPEPTKTTGEDSPKTGDGTPLAAVSLAVLAAGSTGLLLLKKKK